MHWQLFLLTSNMKLCCIALMLVVSSVIHWSLLKFWNFYWQYTVYYELTFWLFCCTYV